MSAVSNYRRYCLLKSQANRDRGDDALAEAWLTKHSEATGADLPADFPLLTELTAAFYTTAEDLEGADVNELRQRVGLTRSQAEAVIAAVALL